MSKLQLLLSVLFFSGPAFATGGARGVDMFDCRLGGEDLHPFGIDEFQPQPAASLRLGLEDGPSGWTNAMPLVIYPPAGGNNPITQLNECLSLDDAKLDFNIPVGFGANVGDVALVCGNLKEKPYRFITPVKKGWLGVIRKAGANLIFTLFEFKRENGQHNFVRKSHVSGLCKPVLSQSTSR
jgi:hypothetical protein